MTRYLMAAAVALALCGGLYAKGRSDGRAVAEAAHAEATAQLQADLFAAAEQSSRRSAEIEAFRAAQDTLAMEAEDAARADNPDSRRPADGSLRRLKTRWGAAGAP